MQPRLDRINGDIGDGCLVVQVETYLENEALPPV
jgi:hypothetical protein